jgi:hypothetical protein
MPQTGLACLEFETPLFPEQKYAFRNASWPITFVACDDPKPLLKDFAELFKNNPRTFKPACGGRKLTPCVEWQVNNLRFPLGKSMPEQNCEPKVRGRNGHRQLFSGEK